MKIVITLKFPPISFDSSYIVAPRVLCYSQEHLLYYADEIVNDDGEGVILRTPQSPYVNGRTDLLIKIKAWIVFFYIQKEGIVY
jgi:ATP-dependent DNA ligase